MSPTFVNCPQCGTSVPWTYQQRFKPFCSERCKLIDLGEWATEAKRIPGESLLLINDKEGEESFFNN